mmetsp:Transcript_19927/g.43317  ORF Transcript_19927/g.43317 Transcript_19927/m.43317 type:complete len:231 (-) Transcript_19927:1408-2100(-)
MFKISLLPSRSGNGTSILTSSRPGRKSASSSSSLRLVVPITKMLPRAFTPSNLARIWLTAEARATSPLPDDEDRCRKTASISSITMTCNPDCAGSPRQTRSSASASSKSLRTEVSVPPTHRSKSSGAETIFGGRSVSNREISLASAVLPQPGFPYSNNPRTGDNPNSSIVWSSEEDEDEAAAPSKRLPAAPLLSTPRLRPSRTRRMIDWISGWRPPRTVENVFSILSRLP